MLGLAGLTSPPTVSASSARPVIVQHTRAWRRTIDCCSGWSGRKGSAMWSTIFIAVHATTGVVALLSGLVAVRHGRLFEIYLWSLVGMTLFLALAAATDWSATSNGGRVLFTAFAVLAG